MKFQTTFIRSFFLFDAYFWQPWGLNWIISKSKSADIIDLKSIYSIFRIRFHLKIDYETAISPNTSYTS